MFQVTEAQWDEAQATIARLTEEGRRLVEGCTTMAENVGLMISTVSTMHENIKALEARLEARIAPIEDHVADSLEADAYASDDLDTPTPKRRKIDDGGPQVIPFERPATSFDAALRETEIEDACRALELDEATFAYVMEGHRHSDGKLLATILGRGGNYRTYVECRLAIRDGLRGE